MNTLGDGDWQPVCVVDAHAANRGEGERCYICNKSLRWQHWLRNGQDEYIGVGGCCAKRLIHGYDARGAERNAINKANRVRSFTNPKKWKTSRNNPANIWRLVLLTNRASARVTVFEKYGSYGVFVARRQGNNACPPDRFVSRAEAMRFAFALIEELKVAQK